MNLLYANPVLACFANDNDALIPELWAQEGLAILEENMVMARLVHRDFSPEVANYGDVVNTRRPGTFTTARKTDADSVVAQDAVATNVPVPLDQHIYVTFTIKDGEASKAFQDLVDLYLTPAAQQIARSVDRILVGQVHEFLTNSAGRLNEMTVNNAKDFLLDCREKMNVNKAYPSGRNIVLSPSAETELLKTELFIAAHKRGDEGTALREASLGRLLGFDSFMDQNTPALANTATVDQVAGVVDEVEPVGETTVNCTITGYLAQAGEYVWIEGEGQPHVITAATGTTDTDTINLDSGLLTAIGVNDAVVVYKKCDVNTANTHIAGYAKGINLDGFTASKPPVTGQLIAFGTGASRHVYTIIESYATGALQTVWLDRPLEAQLANDDVAYPGPTGSFNLAFHRNALALVTRPLALPNTALGVRSSVGVYNDVAMRVSMQYDINSQGTIVTLDLLCGVATLDTNLGCVLLS
jgi:hypothetical protein